MGLPCRCRSGIVEADSSGEDRGTGVKRLVDIALGTALAVLVFPVVVLLAIALAITLRAWPFFVHTRVGQDGQRFRLPKLRTLPPDAPQYADKYEIAEFERKGLAGLLRKTHLDELPQ